MTNKNRELLLICTVNLLLTPIFQYLFIIFSNTFKTAFLDKGLECGLMYGTSTCTFFDSLLNAAAVVYFVNVNPLVYLACYLISFPIVFWLYKKTFSKKQI